MKANRGARLADDDVGTFPVVEAILVVILVLTAILFFTSVQRPTTGSDAGGIDLGRVAADTLRIVQLRVFDATTTTGAPYDGVDMTMEEWVTNLAAGDGTSGAGNTATVIDDFLSEVLPTGARYSLRLSNGVDSLPILPQGAVEEPQGATASEIMFVPDWDAFEAFPPVAAVQPGQLLTSGQTGYTWTDSTSPTIQCVKSPLGQSTKPDGSDAGTVGDRWITSWEATAGQVPFDAPFGTWAGYGAIAADGSCTGAVVQYLKVVRDSTALRIVADGQTSDGVIPPTVPVLTATQVRSVTAAFTASDVGKSLRAISSTGTSLVPAGTTIASLDATNPTTIVNLSGTGATADATGVTLVIGLDNPYPPYGLQLVVWFGA